MKKSETTVTRGADFCQNPISRPKCPKMAILANFRAKFGILEADPKNGVRRGPKMRSDFWGPKWGHFWGQF
jgi:hypothetical protein